MRVKIIYPWVAHWPRSTAVEFHVGIKRADGTSQLLRRAPVPPATDYHPSRYSTAVNHHYRRWRLRQYNFDLQISRWSFGFWYLLLDIHYCSLVSQIGAVLFLHGIILRRWLGRSLKTLSSSSDFPYFDFE